MLKSNAGAVGGVGGNAGSCGTENGEYWWFGKRKGLKF